MANKYIRHGETYCGDGTTSAAATSNGGVGAWNNINVLEGTAPAYGALAAGDVVYIRSKDVSGNDITRTLSASVTLGSSAATTAAWITWVIDAGTVWSGINGKVQYDCPSSYVVTLRTFNQYRADSKDKLVVRETNTSANKQLLTFAGSLIFENMLVDMSVATTGNGDWIANTGTTDGLAINLSVKVAAHYYDAFRLDSYSKLVLVDPDIELLQAESRSAVFSGGDYGSSLLALGGKIYGAGATDVSSVVKLVNGRAGLHRFVGTKIPRAMKMVYALTTGNWRVEGVGLDGTSGAYISEAWGYASSRSDGYFPTCNAALPDSVATPWSWWLYPAAASPLTPLILSSQKIFTDTAAAKTITLNLLLAGSVSGANKSTVWAVFRYVDNATGETITVSTKDAAAGALDASSAGWSATTYGAVNLLKRKIEITTPSSIKQDTPVSVTFYSTWKSATALDIAFLDPDLVIS